MLTMSSMVIVLFKPRIGHIREKRLPRIGHIYPIKEVVFRGSKNKTRDKESIYGKILEVIVLVNSGFETETPQLLVPVAVAERLDLWPSLPRNYSVVEYMTAGGPVRNYVLRNEILVKVKVEYDTQVVLSDLVISTIENEVLIGDKLAGELGIIVYDFAKGIWRLKSDSENTRRISERRQVW